MRTTIGPHDLELVVPASYTVRVEVVTLSIDSMVRAKGAALGYCWGVHHRGLLQGIPTPRQCRDVASVYGQAVVDGLIGKGVPLAEIMRAGGQALELLSSGLVAEQEVEAAANFSGPPEGGSTE